MRRILAALLLAASTIALGSSAHADPQPYPSILDAKSYPQALAQLDLLRAQIAQAEQDVRTSAEAAETARINAVAARSQASYWAWHARTAQNSLDQMANQMYITGGITPLTTAGALMEAGTVTGVLDTTYKLGHVASESTERMKELVHTQQQASAAEEAAVAAELAANQASRLAQWRLQDLSRQLDEAAAFAKSLAGAMAVDTGTQVLVGPQGCPKDVPWNVLRDGSEAIGAYELCARSVAAAPTPAAALAIKFAFSHLGDPYACKGVGRMDPHRFDCSSFVSRAYFEGAGVPVASDTWAPSTRNMIPWDGVPLDSWYSYVPPEQAKPGDLLLFRSCTQEPCAYQHVTMMLADGFMAETNSCGDVAHVSAFSGFDDPSFLVVRRVMENGVPGPSVMDPLLPTEAPGEVFEPGDLADGGGFVPGPSKPSKPGKPSPSQPAQPPTVETPAAAVPDFLVSDGTPPAVEGDPAPDAFADPGPGVPAN